MVPTPEGISSPNAIQKLVEMPVNDDGRSSKDSQPDHTHLGPEGRRTIGILAAQEFVRVVPALRPYMLSLQ